MVLNEMFKKKITSFLIVLIVFFLDRLSKFFILDLSQPSGELNIYVSTFLNFNLVWNKGIAFGLFSFDQKIYYNLITSLIVFITIIILWLASKSKGLEKFSFLIIIGGSLGNLFDRLYYSSVIDFIDVSYNNFHWFIFNVADIFISLGVLILIALEFFRKKI